MMGGNEGKMSQLGEGLSDCSSEVARAIGRICERHEWSDLHMLLSQYFDSNFKFGLRRRVKESFSMNGASKHQLCLCLKAGIDASLDVNRSVYLQAVDDTVQLIQEYQQQCIDGRRVQCRHVRFENDEYGVSRVLSRRGFQKPRIVKRVGE